MAIFTVKLPSGNEWTPTFIEKIDKDRCIGCGRCFKICSHQVLELRGLDADGEFVAADLEDDEEYERQVMVPAQPDNCIGCASCAKVCTKRAFTHAPALV
jgi:Nif-specific ferredoxin III